MGKEIRWRRNFLLSFATGAVRRMGGVAVIRCAARCPSQGHGCPATISTPASMGKTGPVTQITLQRALRSPSCTPMTSPTRSVASSPESRAPRSLISRVWAFREKGRPSASMPNTRTTRSAMKRGSGWSDMQWWRARHFEGSLAFRTRLSRCARASMPPFRVRLQGLLLKMSPHQTSHLLAGL